MRSQLWKYWAKSEVVFVCSNIEKRNNNDNNDNIPPPPSCLLVLADFHSPLQCHYQLLARGILKELKNKMVGATRRPLEELAQLLLALGNPRPSPPDAPLQLSGPSSGPLQTTLSCSNQVVEEILLRLYDYWTTTWLRRKGDVATLASVAWNKR